MQLRQITEERDRLQATVQAGQQMLAQKDEVILQKDELIRQLEARAGALGAAGGGPGTSGDTVDR